MPTIMVPKIVGTVHECNFFFNFGVNTFKSILVFLGVPFFIYIHHRNFSVSLERERENLMQWVQGLASLHSLITAHFS